MTVTTIFGCRGQNEAGNGPLVESHVGVKPSGITGFVSFLNPYLTNGCSHHYHLGEFTFILGVLGVIVNFHLIFR